MKIKIGDKIIFLNASVRDAPNARKAVIGLNSGKAFTGSHFLFLDYDETDPIEEFSSIVKQNGLRRGMVLISSERKKQKFHAISFSPIPYPKMLEITSKSSCDPNHKACTIRFGFATLRITSKNNGSNITMKDFINNPNGTNFYSWDHEKGYLKMISGEKNDG